MTAVPRPDEPRPARTPADSWRESGADHEYRQMADEWEREDAARAAA